MYARVFMTNFALRSRVRCFFTPFGIGFDEWLTIFDCKRGHKILSALLAGIQSANQPGEADGNVAIASRDGYRPFPTGRDYAVSELMAGFPSVTSGSSALSGWKA